MRVHEIEVSKLPPDIIREWPDETVLEFRDVRDVLRYVEGGPVAKHDGWLPSRDRIPDLMGLFNTVDKPDDALELARHGWREGADRFMDMAAEVTRTVKAQVLTNSFRPDTTGVEPNISAYLTGQPEDMLGWRKGQSRARHLNIVVDVNVRCSACGKRHHDAEPTPPSWVLLRGVAILILVRALQRARYTVTLSARTTSLFTTVVGVSETSRQYWWWPYYSGLRADGRPERSHKLTTVVPLYHPGQMPNYQELAFALVHNDFTRVLLWRAEETYHFEKFGAPRGKELLSDWMLRNPTAARSQCINMAGRLPLKSSHHRLNLSYLPAPDILVPSIPMFEDAHGGDDDDDKHGVFGSVDTTLDWVFETLKEQGVKLT